MAFHNPGPRRRVDRGVGVGVVIAATLLYGAASSRQGQNPQAVGQHHLMSVVEQKENPAEVVGGHAVQNDTSEALADRPGRAGSGRRRSASSSTATSGSVDLGWMKSCCRTGTTGRDAAFTPQQTGDIASQPGLSRQPQHVRVAEAALDVDDEQRETLQVVHVDLARSRTVNGGGVLLLERTAGPTGSAGLRCCRGRTGGRAR